MAESMRDSISKTRCTVTESSFGRMDANIWEIGKTENSMEKDSTFCQTGSLKPGNGMTERRLNG